MSELIFPHQEVIEHYKLENKKMGAENDARIKQLNELISRDDLSSEEVEGALKESRLIAGVLLERFSDVSQDDVENYKAEQTKLAEAKQKVKDSVADIKQQIEILKEEEKEKQNEEEEEIEDVPSPSSKEDKINQILEFIKDNGYITKEELIEFGMKNINDAKEIILIPDKYKLVQNEDGNYIVSNKKEEKSSGGLGVVLTLIGIGLAGFLGYKYIKRK